MTCWDFTFLTPCKQTKCCVCLPPRCFFHLLLTNCHFSFSTQKVVTVYLFLKGLPACTLVFGKRDSTSLRQGNRLPFTKRSQEAIRQKIALENCSF